MGQSSFLQATFHILSIVQDGYIKRGSRDGS
jgi:hypothetical protein